MKKALIVIIPILIVLVVGVLFIFMQFVKPVDLDFAEKITLNYEYINKDISLEITDKDDFDNLKKICRGTVVYDFSIPSCGFGTAELIFEGKGKKIIIYPACDSCTTMRLGIENKYFYSISKENREKLVQILAKYDAIFPCI